MVAHARRWYALALLCVAGFMVILDAQIVVLALPSIAADLGFSATGAQWVMSAYLLSFGGLLLAGVPVDGGFVRDLLPGLLLFGPGLGACAVAGAIAALTGVGERESGVASGINTAAFQVGGAFGVAVVTSVAVSSTSVGEPLEALTAGYRAAFTACVVLAAAGLACALALLRGPGRRRPDRPDAAVTPSAPPPPSRSARTAPPSPQPTPARRTAGGP